MNRLQTGLLSAIALTLALATPATAQFRDYFAAWIDGAQPVPPTNSESRGSACIHLYGDMLVGEIWLPLPAATPVTGMSINGPAPAGSNAPVLFTLSPDPSGTALVSIGPLDAVQIQQLLDRLWYINVQTVAFPAGELRGQLFEILHHVNPCTLATQANTWGAVKVLYR